MSIVIELPLPPKELKPNHRCHWRAKLKPKAEARYTAYVIALVAISELPTAPRWKLAEVQATWYLARQNDSDNLLASIKHHLDGIADAGIVDNDRGFIFLPPKQVLDPKRNGKRGLVLTITERKDEA